MDANLALPLSQSRREWFNGSDPKKDGSGIFQSHSGGGLATAVSPESSEQ